VVAQPASLGRGPPARPRPALRAFGCFAVALRWLILSSHGGAAELGLVVGCYGLTRAIGIPAGGYLADHGDPRRVMILTNATRFGLTGALGALAVVGHPAVYILVPFALLHGACGGAPIRTSARGGYGALLVGLAAGALAGAFAARIPWFTDRPTLRMSAGGVTLLAILVALANPAFRNYRAGDRFIAPGETDLVI
jgi:MFS family permease